MAADAPFFSRRGAQPCASARNAREKTGLERTARRRREAAAARPKPHLDLLLNPYNFNKYAKFFLSLLRLKAQYLYI
jgi:hypothetical protein